MLFLLRIHRITICIYKVKRLDKKKNALKNGLTYPNPQIGYFSGIIIPKFYIFDYQKIKIALKQPSAYG